jgi:hypothetical protein
MPAWALAAPRQTDERGVHFLSAGLNAAEKDIAGARARIDRLLGGFQAVSLVSPEKRFRQHQDCHFSRPRSPP